MLKKPIFSLIIMFFSGTSFSQISTNIYRSNINTFLHISEKNDLGVKIYNGILYPKYTTNERDNNLIGLTEKDNGLIIYNKTDGCFNYWRQGTNYPIGKWAVYGKCTQ